MLKLFSLAPKSFQRHTLMSLTRSSDLLSVQSVPHFIIQANVTHLITHRYLWHAYFYYKWRPFMFKAHRSFRQTIAQKPKKKQWPTVQTHPTWSGLRYWQESLHRVMPRTMPRTQCPMIQNSSWLQGCTLKPRTQYPSFLWLESILQWWGWDRTR